MHIYIPPFICGVIVTILLEFVLCIVVAVISSISKEKGGESNAEESDPVPTSTYDNSGKFTDGTG